MSAVLPYLLGFYAAICLWIGFCIYANASEDGPWTWLAAVLMMAFWPILRSGTWPAPRPDSTTDR